ncbi:NHL domain-containing protein [Streptomyces sp. NPDC003877]
MTMGTETATSQGDEPVPAIRTVAGSGTAGYKGDGEPAVDAQLNRPYGMAFDSTGALYLADFTNHRVRKITTDGRISTVAGNGTAGFGGDDGPAASARLNYPRELAVDGADALYIADGNNHRVRKVTPDGTITTVAGTGTAGFSGDGGPATAARLNGPFGVAVDSEGVLYIGEHGNARVRKVTPDGQISTVAGNGSAGAGGDGGPAVSAQLNRPHAVVVDGAGALYIAEFGSHRIRKVAADGTISTVAGTGAAGFGGDGGPAASAKLNGPTGVAVDSMGTLYVADYVNHRIRAVAPDGTISTVAGTGAAGFGGDGGPAASAQTHNPIAVAVDCVDAVHIADFVNNRIRKIPSRRLAGLPEAGAVVAWANVRSKLRMAVAGESTRDGAEVHQCLAVPRNHQQWRLIPVGQDAGEVLYRIENVRSRKVLEVLGAHRAAGAVVAQRDYEGGEAHHQHWRLIPVGSGGDGRGVFEIANRNSGLLLRVDTNARTVITQQRAEGDHRNRQWRLLPA